MAYLSVPPKGSLFQNDKFSPKINNWKRLSEAKRILQREEYLHRHVRKSNRDDNENITLNIGGSIFRTRKSTLRNVPGTKLAELNEQSSHYDKALGGYFYDRNPFLFPYILDYYRNGIMHIPSKICSTLVRQELKYWDLGDGCIPECCRKPYFDEIDANTTYELIKAEFYSLPTFTADQNVGSGEPMATRKPHLYTWWQKFKRKAWVIIDNHESSFSAKVFAFVYYGLTIITILNLIISTLPSIRSPTQKHVFIRASTNDTPPTHYTVTLGNETTIYRMLTTDQPDIITWLDIFCLLFFTGEFIFRLMVCPSVRYRFRSWYTLLDILYLVPAWARLIVDVTNPFYWQQGFKQASLMIVIDAMLVSKVFRIFRLSRHYRGMRVLLLAVKASVGELTLLIVFVMMALLIFSSLIYCAEQYQADGSFDSIVTGFWWSLITLTTVGYGDTVPTGLVGRIIACFCAFTGLLIIGMVIPIISGNFNLYYGFRHAGCEALGLYKPEFVPSELENPPPDLNDGPMDQRLAFILFEQENDKGSETSAVGAPKLSIFREQPSTSSNMINPPTEAPRSKSPFKWGLRATAEVAPAPSEDNQSAS